MSAAGLAGWAIDALVASTLLLAAVLLIRVPVRRAFGPGIAYLLWALPLLRLVLPPLPIAWREAATTPISRAGETLTILVVEPAGQAAVAAPSGSGLSFGLALAGLWGAGAAAFLVFHLVRHARFCRAVLARAEALERVGGVAVVTSDAAPGPLAFGVWRRYVAFPRDFAERYDADERALALAHELGHHQRGDLVANWIALGVLALHWFNPLAWHAFRAFRADQELANDARVLAGRGPGCVHAYGRAIVKAAHGGAVSAACHLHTITDLKGRLKMLARSPASRRRLVSGATAVGALVVAGLGLTASGTGAAALTGSVRQTMGVPPTPPAPAAPPAPPAPIAAPAAPSTTAGIRARKRVVIVKDGKTTEFEGAAADDFLAANPGIAPPPPAPPGAPVPPMRTRILRFGPPGTTVARGDAARTIRFRDVDGKEQVIRVPATPEVVSTTCAGDTAGPTVEHHATRSDRRIVICTNRIEAVTRDARLLAANAATTERQARSGARASLDLARSAIERDRSLSDAQKSQALAGIEQADRELASEDP